MKAFVLYCSPEPISAYILEAPVQEARPPDPAVCMDGCKLRAVLCRRYLGTRWTDSYDQRSMSVDHPRRKERGLQGGGRIATVHPVDSVGGR